MSGKCWHEAPFDRDGNQQTYPGWGCEMRPVEPFEDTLEFIGFSRGRSAANMDFGRSDGTTVSMFLTDAERAVPQMIRGTVTGRFVYVKRGMNYGVALEDE